MAGVAVASAVAAGSATATSAQPVGRGGFSAAGGSCADMYQKAIALCDANDKSTDQRAQCYKWAQVDYKKCVSSQ
ncbi:hypothetical protein [Nocardia wallacei]|uniref:hypothetical protein n=1 Tax=Nocardia wallacei TaxID=480035 RepID=UPI0024570A5B|nr:hypothetical protein [Nocardia wallacei]